MKSEQSLSRRVAELWDGLRTADPQLLAERTGAVYQGGSFRLALWGLPVRITYPDFQCYDANEKLTPTFFEALLAYYFTTTDGRPLRGEWISFTDLPNGRFYTQAFQGYSGRELAQTFGEDISAFQRAAEANQGQLEDFGDCAYSFEVLPKVRILAACWQGDEDFPTSYRILFDAAAGYHLTTDACAIVGSLLTSKLIKKKGH